MASVTKDLEDFVRKALGKGVARDEIARVMREAGWPLDQAQNALSAFVETPFAVPLPRPRPSLSAREAFLYLVMFATLYDSAFHLGSLLFDFINQAFPDAAEHSYTGGMWDQMRWSVSSLVIAFPLFLFVASRLARELAQAPIKRLSSVRRWLTYLTMFGATLLLIGDTTVLVFHVLGGELTVRFVLKVLVVGAISGSIFGYYLWDLRREEKLS